jgi:RNA polymerase-binding transcription factor DksA
VRGLKKKERKMSRFEDRKAQLETRKAVLAARLGGIAEDLTSAHSKDWEEAAVEHEDDEVLEGLGEAGQAELRQINAALARIEDGTYGECMRCGEEIGPQRLDLLPATPFCKRCAG